MRFGREIDLPGVTAADVEAVEAGERPQVLDRLPHPLVPLPVPDALARSVAELRLVRLALAERAATLAIEAEASGDHRGPTPRSCRIPSRPVVS